MSRMQHLLRARENGGLRPRPPDRVSLLEGDGAPGLADPSGSRPDFSHLRVHADTASAAEADALGARAFTSGTDIYFGRDELSAPLLAHELRHVNEQTHHGERMVQFQARREKAGIGATPPEEGFIKDPDNWGAEDSDVLFETDDARLDSGDEEILRAFAAQQSEPVSVHIHGYASREGPPDYNFNLSAHRGVGAKQFLEPLLPPGSKVVVFAHGESKHFGAADRNRRVGISLIGPVSGGGFHLKLDPDLQLKLAAPPATPLSAPVVSPLPRLTLDPSYGVGAVPGPSPLTSGGLTVSTPRHLMDNSALVAPSGFHGVSPTATGNVVDQWDAAYRKYRALGLPDSYKLGPFDLGAGELANKEVANSVGVYHERNNPTVIEKSNKEVGAHVITSPNLWPYLFGDKDRKPGGKR